MITNPKDFFDQVKNLCEEVGLQLAEVFRRLDTTTAVGATKVELEAGLAKKAEKQHSHPISDVNDLQASLDNKLDKTANAVSASKWQTARKLKLSGDVSGEASVDGSGDVTVTTTVADDSHNHVIGNVDGLQALLDAKLAASTYNTDKPTFATKATTYTKAEVDAKVASVYRPKGSVASYDALPASAAIGDVYNLLSTGANYVWTDSGWDKLSETVDLTPYLTTATASSTYLTQTNASNTYLSKTDASNTYLGKTAKAASAATADTATSATKATQDGAGNVITETYATKAEIESATAAASAAQASATAAQASATEAQSAATAAQSAADTAAADAASAVNAVTTAQSTADTAKAIAEAALPKAAITSGTTDLTAGSSELATGSIYLMYE